MHRVVKVANINCPDSNTNYRDDLNTNHIPTLQQLGTDMYRPLYSNLSVVDNKFQTKWPLTLTFAMLVHHDNILLSRNKAVNGHQKTQTNTMQKAKLLQKNVKLFSTAIEVHCTDTRSDKHTQWHWMHWQCPSTSILTAVFSVTWVSWLVPPWFSSSSSSGNKWQV